MSISGCASVPPLSMDKLNDSVTQVIFVHQINKIPYQAILSTWQKKGDSWHRLYVMRAVIGRNGMAPQGEKREGDGRTPSGVYPLGPAFGYAPSIATNLSYRQATKDDFWVDDVGSLQYNQWVKGKPNARSFEKMKRLDNLYQYGIVIGYNTDPIVPGLGSAIFMHVWRRYDSSTAGCVAVNQRYLRRILRWLAQENKPVIILESNNA